MTRLGVPANATPGIVHTVVIDLHPEGRSRWLTTTDMDDDDLEAYEQQLIRQEEREAREERDKAERAKLAVIYGTREPLPEPPPNAYTPGYDVDRF